MKTSTDRILTSHVGSLPRPPDLLKLIKAKVAAQPFDEKELGAEVRKAIDQCVRRQADIGLDVISDGEMSKPSFLTYIVERLGGVEVTNEPFGNPWKGSRCLSRILCVGSIAQPQSRRGGEARHLHRPCRIQGARPSPQRHRDLQSGAGEREGR